jgi:hypothetical protein
MAGQLSGLLPKETCSLRSKTGDGGSQEMPPLAGRFPLYTRRSGATGASTSELSTARPSTRQDPHIHGIYVDHQPRQPKSVDIYPKPAVRSPAEVSVETVEACKGAREIGETP